MKKDMSEAVADLGEREVRATEGGNLPARDHSSAKRMRSSALFWRALTPIWSKCVLMTMTRVPVTRCENSPMVTMRLSAASHPMDGTSGVSLSQRVS